MLTRTSFRSLYARVRGNPRQSAKTAAIALGLCCLMSANVPQAAPPSSASKSNMIESVGFRDGTNATDILVRGTGVPTFNVYKLSSPSRVVLDVARARVAPRLLRQHDGKQVVRANTWSVGQVVAYPVAGARGKLVRVAIHLAREARYKVTTKGNTVIVSVRAIAPRPKATTNPALTGKLKQARQQVWQAQRAMTTIEREKRALQKSVSDARAELARAKREVERARTRSERLRSQAHSSRASAQRSVAAVQKELAAAKSRAARAEALVQNASKRAESERKELRTRADEAEARAVVAQQQLAHAKRVLDEAKETRNQARRERIAAAEARSTALKAKRDAERVMLASKRVQAQAQTAKQQSASAQQARKKAEAQAKAAETKRRQAESALRFAEMRRMRAVQAAEAAEKRVRDAMARARSAEAKRSDAEKAREAADARRAEASRLRSQALRDAKEAESRAKQARALRHREEASYRRVMVARKTSEAKNTKAIAAVKSLEASLVAKRKAAGKVEASLDKLQRLVVRREAERNQRVARKLSKEIAATKSRLKRARVELRDRRNTVRAKERKLSALEAEHKVAEAKLVALQKRANAVRVKRVSEEQRLNAVTKSWRDAQSRLASTRAEIKAAKREMASLQTKRHRSAASGLQPVSYVASKKPARAKKPKRRATTAGVKTLRARVDRVSYSETARAGRVTLAVTGKVRPRILRRNAKSALLSLPKAALAPGQARTMDVSRYGGPISTISVFPSPKDPANVRVLVRLAYASEGMLKRSGKDFVWDFRRMRPATASVVHPRVVGGFGATSTPITQQTVTQLGNKRRKIYRGRKISLNLRNTAVQDVMRAIAAGVPNLDIIVPPEINDAITVSFERTPWDQVLEIILSTRKLWYVRYSSGSRTIIRVARREDLQKEADLRAKRMAANPPPLATDYVTLNYTKVADIAEQIRKMITPDRGQVYVNERTNTVVVTDIASKRQQIIQLLKQLDTPEPQITIKTRIVEARSSFAREFGVQWGGGANLSAATGNSTGLLFPNSIGVAGGADDANTIATGVPLPTDFAVNLPAAVGSGAGGAIGLALGSVGGNFNLSLRLSALENQGRVRIISEPKIQTSNNIKGTIKRGVNIPISVTSANGVQTQFVQANLELEVTPTVSQDDCSVTMEIIVKKNEADFTNTGAAGDPSILTNEAKSTILVPDGATTVMGGIYTSNKGVSYSKVPFFGDLPLIGWMFRKTVENDDRNELLIFVTPRITNRAKLPCK